MRSDAWDPRPVLAGGALRTGNHFGRRTAVLAMRESSTTRLDMYQTGRHPSLHLRKVLCVEPLHPFKSQLAGAPSHALTSMDSHLNHFTTTFLDTSIDRRISSL